MFLVVADQSIMNILEDLAVQLVLGILERIRLGDQIELRTESDPLVTLALSKAPEYELLNFHLGLLGPKGHKQARATAQTTIPRASRTTTYVVAVSNSRRMVANLH